MKLYISNKLLGGALASGLQATLKRQGSHPFFKCGFFESLRWLTDIYEREVYSTKEMQKGPGSGQQQGCSLSPIHSLVFGNSGGGGIITL